MPHANWHRLTAVVVRDALQLILEDIPATFVPPVAGFPNLIDGLPAAIGNALALVNSVTNFVDGASGLNLCRIFELAKFNAEVGPLALLQIFRICPDFNLS